jgi:hypothetical protein
MQLDGDAVEADLPARVALHPAKLRILVPAAAQVSSRPVAASAPGAAA